MKISLSSISFHKGQSLNSRGDTLVEVLICLAIIATILGGAFVTTRNSRLGVRNSAEHSEALKIAENQTEQIRYNASRGDQSVLNQSSSFCMKDQTPTGISCTVDGAGNPVAAGTVPSYNISINDCNDPSCGNDVDNSDLFTTQVSWDQVTGGTAQESMVYRVSNAGGAAAFKGQGCGTSPCTGGLKYLPGASYHWGRAFTNISPAYQIPLVTGCTWTYGDGSAAVSSPPLAKTGPGGAACDSGDVLSHSFTIPAGWPSTYDPSLCATLNYQVQLTLNLSNGTNPTYSKIVTMPKCY